MGAYGCDILLDWFLQKNKNLTDTVQILMVVESVTHTHTHTHTPTRMYACFEENIYLILPKF